MRHHIWCNEQNVYNPEQGAWNCKMCKGLRKNYPEIEGDDKDSELMKKHFPNAIKVEQTNG